MMKGLSYLLTRPYHAKSGNHTVEFTSGKTIRIFRYHGNAVCVANDKTKVFKLEDCGYSKSPSTTRTLNDYRKHFTSIGYEEIKEENYEL